MTDIWGFLLQTLTASGAAVLVLAVKWMFQDKLPPRWQFAAWVPLAVMLLLPAGWGGRYAIVNWPRYVEGAKTLLTGDYTLTRVTAPIPLPRWEVPGDAAGWLYAVYVLGAFLLLARYLLSYLRLRLALRRGRPADPAPVRAVAEKYGLPACRCVEAEGLGSAFLCGLFRPVLALPAGEAVDEKVILHELVHLKQRDTLWGVAIALLRCLHWCDPLLWYCAGRAGNDLEARCDQRVLELLEGEERRDYGRVLLSMANERYAQAPGTSSMANGGKNIRRRIEAIARFKKYPAGMGLVSSCMVLLLAAPLVAGARTETIWRAYQNDPYCVELTMASARTTFCTTYAGAFDAYAKAVLGQNGIYRAMCAPVREQAALAETLKAAKAGGWFYAHWEPGLPGYPNQQGGYQIYDLEKAGDGYEGLLVLPLNNAPEGEEWDGTERRRWLAVQPLRAEKEGSRWVIVPQGDFQAVQSDARDGGNDALPAWRYEAESGDFTARWSLQTACRLKAPDSGIHSSPASFDPDPQPDGTFVLEQYDTLSVIYTGAPEDRGLYTQVGLSAASWVPRMSKRQALPDPGPGGSNGFRADAYWGSKDLEGDWGPEVVLGGGEVWQNEEKYTRPVSYDADLYLNGSLAAELSLLPVEGGPQ